MVSINKFLLIVKRLEHNALVCIPLSPVFSRHTGGVPNFIDEATASLDVENETLIQESLSRLIENKTVMIIAHRMRTVAGADKIVVLSEGIVAEQGSSDMLLKKGGIYAHMVKLQTQSQNWAME